MTLIIFAVDPTSYNRGQAFLQSIHLQGMCHLIHLINMLGRMLPNQTGQNRANCLREVVTFQPLRENYSIVDCFEDAPNLKEDGLGDIG